MIKVSVSSSSSGSWTSSLRIYHFNTGLIQKTFYCNDQHGTAKLVGEVLLWLFIQELHDLQVNALKA